MQHQKKAQTRLARDKNRYKASSHNADGVTYVILILGVVYWLEIDSFIYTDKDAFFKKEEGRGEQTRIKPYSKFTNSNIDNRPNR